MTHAEHLALMCQIRASALRMAAQNASSVEERAEFQEMAEHWIRKADEVGRSLPAQ